MVPFPVFTGSSCPDCFLFPGLEMKLNFFATIDDSVKISVTERVEETGREAWMNQRGRTNHGREEAVITFEQKNLLKTIFKFFCGP